MNDTNLREYGLQKAPISNELSKWKTKILNYDTFISYWAISTLCKQINNSNSLW